MRILILSRDGAGSVLVRRLEQEGNEVKVFCRNRVGRDGYLVTWRPSIAWADLIVATDPSWGTPHEHLFRKLGRPTLCINNIANSMTQDGWKAHKVYEKAGVMVPITRYVDTSSGESVKQAMDAWTGSVLVNSGAVRGWIRCDSVDEFGPLMEELKDTGTAIVRERLNGIEVRTTGLFNGRHWVRPFWHELMDMGMYSQSGNCFGGVVVRSDGDKITDTTLSTVEPILSKAGYRGFFSVESFVQDIGLCVLSVKAGINAEGLCAMLEGSRDNLGDLLFEVAQGVREEVDVTEDVMAVVKVWSELGLRMPIMGLEEGNMKHLWFDGVQGPGFLMERDFNVLATAIGRNVGESLKRAKRTVNNISFVGKHYQHDVGQRAVQHLSDLASGGWIHA